MPTADCPEVAGQTTATSDGKISFSFIGKEDATRESEEQRGQPEQAGGYRELVGERVSLPSVVDRKIVIATESQSVIRPAESGRQRGARGGGPTGQKGYATRGAFSRAAPKERATLW